MSRRKFVGRTTAGLIGAAATARSTQSRESAAKASEAPLIVSTWAFGKASNDAALQILQKGGALLDAIEQGMWVTESAGDPSVGLSGKPNAAGVVQLDACIMYGPAHKAGSVAALEGIRHPISAARRVMEKTPHVMLVGECARMFALEQGLESVETHARAHYETWQKQRAEKRAKAPPEKAPNHDTLALIALAADGTIAGGCSTSGLAGKLPGRVGDSPIIGSGLYVDNEVGAAGATGVGENVMRYCASFLIVEYMRQGMHPREACVETIRRIIKSEAKLGNLSINFIALDKHGRYGAAGTDDGFQYSVATPNKSGVLANPTMGKFK